MFLGMLIFHPNWVFCKGSSPGFSYDHFKGIEWSLRASASMRAECLFLRARAFDKQSQKFCEHEQASTHLIFASNSSKGQILRALLN